MSHRHHVSRHLKMTSLTSNRHRVSLTMSHLSMTSHLSSYGSKKSLMSKNFCSM